ncbi:peptidase S10 [Gluconacetobacter aggeris]|uniref:Peptidase S10 n=1 Tax=Gluconacetobacter aggeris TaxID=1286186 RepID=A0A7W4NXH2_9PROT|nr:peptidase S10 [Gluconacetobacter aggeris]MBB2169737.1 peptidase S10 [Gluconacetobacter aggeris]
MRFFSIIALAGAYLCASSGGASAATPAKLPDTAVNRQLLPPYAQAHQSIRFRGETLRYTVTVGALPVRDATGQLIAQVAYTAYLRDSTDPDGRPVTFALNGGPGASSAFLNFGALGPRRLQFGATGDRPSDSIALHDNPGTWLDMSDLVFIDPVGTGYSRSFLNDAESLKAFYGTDVDIRYLSRAVYDWLSRSKRMASPKYLVGESYGGFRVPRMIRLLQTEFGVGINGAVLVSPFLDSGAEFDPTFSPMPWVITLPSMAAARLEREGALDKAHMQPIIDYARGDYLRDLVKGRSDPEATERRIGHVTALTGLDPAFVRRAGGRIEVEAFLREATREQGKIASSADSNFLIFDPAPDAPDLRAGDPLVESVLAQTTSAMVDFLSREVGWHVGAPYYTINFDIEDRFQWRGEHGEQVDSQDLRRVTALNPKLHILIAHGWNDLSTPFMASALLVDQLPAASARDQVQVKEYVGGHMFYNRMPSLLAFHDDAEVLYRFN